MENEYVKILLDNKAYKKVALLVDRPDFLKDIKKIREKWGIDRPLSKYFTTTYDTWLEFLDRKPNPKTNDKLRQIIGELKIYLSIKEHINSQKNPSKNLIKDIAKLIVKTQLFYFYWDILQLQIKYNAPDNFNHIIGSAIACNKVTEKEWIKDTYYNSFKSEKEGLFYLNQGKIILVLDDGITQSLAINAIRKTIPKNRDSRKPGTSFYDVLIKSDLRKTRVWYFESLKSSQKKVAEKYQIVNLMSKKEVDNQRGILKAIGAYKELLERPL